MPDPLISQPARQQFDVDQYLLHIKANRPVSIDIKSLKELQLAHLKTVPFENLDIHYSRPISLKLNDIFDKVVVNERGGFCYELNGLFHALLQELGFDARMASARGTRANGEFAPEFDHLAIIVAIDGEEYLTDVGFGRFAIAPLRLNPGVTISDGVGDFQIEYIDDEYLQVSRLEEGVLHPEYIFTLSGRSLDEFMGMCEFHQTSTDSHFTRKKLISILTEDGRKTLTNNQFKVTGLQGSDVTDFDPREFEAYLEQQFGIRL